LLGEPSDPKDWGGETSDLYTSRLKSGGKRITAAFAFKGPGKKGKLVPGKMGKNGDQIQRLFQEDADIFIVQYWSEIAPSILEHMRTFAIGKSAMTGREIKYGIIDGQDSERLRVAYRSNFGEVKKRRINSKRK
jgi:hypothetical protein